MTCKVNDCDKTASFVLTRDDGKSLYACARHANIIVEIYRNMNWPLTVVDIIEDWSRGNP